MSSATASRHYLLADAAATEGAGRALAAELAGGMVVALEGDLGAGKTTLVRGILRGLGHEGPVKSPTYAVVEHYNFLSLYLYHFDFYRFADPDEWETAGISDYFRNDALCVVEWPQRVAERLPDADLVLTIDDDVPTGRRLSARASTPAGHRALAALDTIPERRDAR